jgi:predicted nucleic acid-binding protein
MVADSMHTYLDSLPPPTSEGWRNVFAELLGHQQVTDAYLLRLAAANNAVLVTFDRRLEGLAGGESRVIVLGSDSY